MGQNDPATRKADPNPSTQQPGRRDDKGQSTTQGSCQGQVPGRPDADQIRERSPATGPGGGRVDDTQRRKDGVPDQEDTEPMSSGAGKGHQAQSSGASKPGVQQRGDQDRGHGNR